MIRVQSLCYRHSQLIPVEYAHRRIMLVVILAKWGQTVVIIIRSGLGFTVLIDEGLMAAHALRFIGHGSFEFAQPFASIIAAIVK
jgi:hypothetical protein